jgi:hypothetical protein
MYLKNQGINIDAGTFDIEFTQPQNFQEFRQIEIDSAYASVFGQLSGVPYISKRYLLTRYLGWTPDEIVENEKLVKEESDGSATDNDMTGSGGAALGDVGLSPGGFDDFGDVDGFEDFEGGDDITGDEDAGDDNITDADVDNFGLEDQ